MSANISVTRSPHRSINQIELISAIISELDNQGISELVARQMNAVISAANDIIREIEKAPVFSTPNMGLRKWLESDDVGRSSKYMASILFMGIEGIPIGEVPFAEPSDAGDFGRCYRMLRATNYDPKALPDSRMVGRSKLWDALIESWQELEAAYESDIGNPIGTSCYRLMRKIEKAVLNGPV